MFDIRMLTTSRKIHDEFRRRIICIPNITAGLESSFVNLSILAESVALAPETSPWASGNELELLVD